MPTITAQTIVDRAEVLLQDTTNVRWPAAELLGWLNDGQREIVALRPDAAAKTVSHQLVAGTKQGIPADGYSLLKVVRNMGAGSVPGAAIRQVPQEALDSSTPNWHALSAATVTLHYVFDPRTPKTFYVYPPADGSTFVELVYSAVPAAIATLGDVITLDDVYANSLLDYVLYRAYSKDLEVPASAERAAAHRVAFENSLGLKAQADASNRPVPVVRG